MEKQNNFLIHHIPLIIYGPVITVTILVVATLYELNFEYIGYFIAFPYNFADMPSDMMLEDYSIGLFFRQIWVHIAVAIVYVFLMGEKHEALIVPILVVLFFSFDNVKLDVPFIILVNL